MAHDVLFQPLQFRSLTVKNRLLRSNVSGRFDNYDGSGSPVRLNWEERFARGPLANRARLLREVVAAIRAEVGNDFHLQVKISARDLNNAFFPWEKRGNTLAETLEVCRWLEEDGVDAIHVSNGDSFIHPWQPPGPFPLDVAAQTYPTMLPSGSHTLRNYFMFRVPFLRPIMTWLWNRTRPRNDEGINLPDARAIKQALRIPVLVTGGFQNASVIRRAIEDGSADGVSIARPLIANPDLPQVFAAGKDLPERPCTYCNRCTVNVLTNPLGCYELSRFGGDYVAMMREVMSVFEDLPDVH